MGMLNKIRFLFAPKEKKDLIETMYYMKKQGTFDKICDNLGMAEKELFNECCDRIAKSKNIKDLLKQGYNNRKIIYLSALDALTHKIFYDNDFVYRGVPGMVTKGNLKSYHTILDLMESEGYITQEQKISQLDYIHEEIKQLG